MAGVSAPGGLEPIETASVDELRALQLERLRWSLRHAYDNVPYYRKMFDVAAVHPDDGKSLPAGQAFHAAGPSTDGWVIVAVHDSQQSWEQFRDSTLLPRLHEGVEGGFQSPPDETVFEVANEAKA